MSDNPYSFELDDIKARAKYVGLRLAPVTLGTPLPMSKTGTMVYRNGKEYATFVDYDHAKAFIMGVRHASHPELSGAIWGLTPTHVLEGVH